MGENRNHREHYSILFQIIDQRLSVIEKTLGEINSKVSTISERQIPEIHKTLKVHDEKISVNRKLILAILTTLLGLIGTVLGSLMVKP